MAQWILRVKLLSGSKGCKFKPRTSRNFIAFFQKNWKIFEKMQKSSVFKNASFGNSTTYTVPQIDANAEADNYEGAGMLEE